MGWSRQTVKATARITLIDDRVFTPTLEPPTYSKQLYGGGDL